MMMQFRLAAVAIVVLCFPTQIDALAEVSFHSGSTRLRRMTVTSGTGLPPNPSLTTRSEDSEASSKHRGPLMDTINSFRGEICATMKDSHGEKFGSFMGCKRFMEEHCKRNGDQGTLPGYCEAYFKEQDAEQALKKLEGEEKAKKDILEAELAPKASAPAQAPAASPAASPEAASSAPAASPPAGAPVPNGIDGLDDDEKWYFKNGGKDAGRLHMDGDLKLPASGYWGKLVEHEDQKTVTGDWGTEFGPNSKHRSYSDICKDFPDNAWCRRQGLRPSHHKHSSAYRSSANLIALVMLVVFVSVAF